jgi:hypothetical protein
MGRFGRSGSAAHGAVESFGRHLSESLLRNLRTKERREFFREETKRAATLGLRLTMIAYHSPQRFSNEKF